MRKLLCILLGTTLTMASSQAAPSFAIDLVEFQETPSVSNLTKSFNEVLDIVDKTYDEIKKIFASTEKTTLVEKITKLSFDEMSTTALFRKFQGVQPENLPKVRASIVRSADVPAGKQADFEDFFDLIDIQDSQTFQF
jgi:DNA-directed RNA polymerase subunit F